MNTRFKSEEVTVDDGVPVSPASARSANSDKAVGRIVVIDVIPGNCTLSIYADRDRTFRSGRIKAFDRSVGFPHKPVKGDLFVFVASGYGALATNAQRMVVERVV